MAADPTYGPKVHGAGPDELVIESGGVVDFLAGCEVRFGGTDKRAALDAVPATVAAAVVGVAAGYKVARGETALDGGNPTAIATGLTTVVAFALALKGTAAPGLGTCLVTYDISGATVNLYAWKPTGAGDCTLIASTGTETVGWVALGT